MLSMVCILKSKQCRKLSEKQLVPRLVKYAQFYSRILKELAKVISELLMVVSEDLQYCRKMEHGRTEIVCLLGKKKEGGKIESK